VYTHSDQSITVIWHDSHYVFHISLLKPADFFSDEFPERIQHAPPGCAENNQAYFSVDFIMGHTQASHCQLEVP